MKNWILVATIVPMICTVNTASAQIGRSVGHKELATGSVQSPSTPAQRAAYHRTALFTRAATAAMRSGDYAEAEENARASLASGPDAGFAEETLAAALDAQGKTQEALQAYKAIADEGGLEPRNLLPYALLLLKAGNCSQAVSAYNKALPLLADGDMVRKNGTFSSSVPEPRVLSAAIHTALGLQLDWRGYHGTYQEVINQSLTHFQQAATLEPNSSLTNYYVGYGLKRVGRGAEAKVAFQKAAQLDRSGEVKAAAEKALSGR